MKTYRQFIEILEEEKSIAFTYKDGGEDRTVVIVGSSTEIKKVEGKIDSSTELIDPKKVDLKKSWRISASDWLKLK